MFCTDNIVCLRPCKAIIYENGKKKDVVGRFHCWDAAMRNLRQVPEISPPPLLSLTTDRS